jgi:hypothetical protein
VIDFRICAIRSLFISGISILHPRIRLRRAADAVPETHVLRRGARPAGSVIDVTVPASGVHQAGALEDAQMLGDGRAADRHVRGQRPPPTAVASDELVDVRRS